VPADPEVCAPLAPECPPRQFELLALTRRAQLMARRGLWPLVERDREQSVALLKQATRESLRASVCRDLWEASGQIEDTAYNDPACSGALPALLRLRSLLVTKRDGVAAAPTPARNAR